MCLILKHDQNRLFQFEISLRDLCVLCVKERLNAEIRREFILWRPGLLY
jgi:hypothetical protein